MKTIKETELTKMIEAQQFRCALTGWELTPATATVDHIEPIADGGEHAIGNLMVVHEDVNRAKHTMPLGKFVEMCRAIADNA